jgi:hypothetical protein
MAKAAERKWVPDKYQAKLRLRKLDRFSEFHRNICPFFDTWQEAHDFQKDYAAKRVEQAKRELKSAERYAAKVLALQPNT